MVSLDNEEFIDDVLLNSVIELDRMNEVVELFRL